MPYYPQVRVCEKTGSGVPDPYERGRVGAEHARPILRSRLTFLLLILAAFGVSGSGFAVVRFIEVSVCASDKERSEPRRISEQRTCTTLLQPRPTRRNLSQREQVPPDMSLRRELFQRPPPAIRLSHA
jgi:hypothetical protein